MTQAQIDKTRLARVLDPAFHLRVGLGTGGNGNGTLDMCAEQAIDYITGGPGKTDTPTCVDPVIARFTIRLNDATRFAEWRDELKPYLVRQIGTRKSTELTEKRRYMCADWAVRTIAPMAFEFWAEAAPACHGEALGWAEHLRSCKPIADKVSSLAGREVAREARAAAASAAAAAYAAAYAAAAAAAYAAAYAAVYAAAAAAGTAATAAAGAKTIAFSRSLWDESLAFLGRLIDAEIKVAA